MSRTQIDRLGRALSSQASHAWLGNSAVFDEANLVSHGSGTCAGVAAAGRVDRYNSRQPADDVENYLGPWSQVLEKGGYSPEEAKQAAMQFLPDLLRYDRTKPVSYPNGRKLIDDVYSYRFAWLSRGKLPPTGLKPHDDLMWQFPYLGPPVR